MWMSPWPLHLFLRTRIQLCGFKDLVRVQWLQFQPIHITTSKGKLNNPLVSDKDKDNSLLSTLGLSITQIFTSQLGSHWNISSKLLETVHSVAHKASKRNSLLRYGRTPTNLCLPVFLGFKFSVWKWPMKRIHPQSGIIMYRLVVLKGPRLAASLCHEVVFYRYPFELGWRRDLC